MSTYSPESLGQSLRAIAEWTLLVSKDLGIEDEGNDAEPDGQGREAEAAPKLNDDRGRSGHQTFFQLTLLEQFPVLARAVELELFQRLAARKHHRIDGKSLRPEVGVEEVHGEDESHGQQRLVTVDDGGHVDQPAGEQPGEECREPEQ